ncbi:high mobility group protein B1-like [Liolophura sinensis]|uniref:high mobility group protein B1-like n=1 Tax=Liolophura sinensis TaxID=3198878 RepID=UPI003158F60A
MGRTNASGKPKGRMTAYAFFVQTCREEHKRMHPDESVVFAEFSRKCSAKWKVMSEKEKMRFEDMAKRDKERFEREMSTYVPPKGEPTGKRKRKNKDPNAPKRGLSAFFFFCNEERAKVKAANPSLSMGEIARELGKRWEKVQGASRSKYEQDAARDKARYEQEMQAYKAKSGIPQKKGSAAAAPSPKKKAPAVQKKEESEDDDEDDDDEDEDDDDEDEDDDEEDDD